MICRIRSLWSTSVRHTVYWQQNVCGFVATDSLTPRCTVIWLQDFHASAGARSKRFYQTRTEVAEAMGLQTVLIPEVSEEPKKGKTVGDAGQTAARKPCATSVLSPA